MNTVTITELIFMKKSFKYIVPVLAAVLLTAGTMLVAFAEGEDIGDTPVTSDPDPVYSVPADDPVYSEPIDDPVYSEPVDDPAYSVPVDDPIYSQPVDDPSYSEPDYSGNSNQYYDDDPIWYGDASNYDYNTSGDNNAAAGSVSSKTSLYNTSGLSAEEAAPNEWSEITLDEKSVKTGVADFSAIKSNTRTEDDSQWILYLGYLLIILSVLGVLYFIVATLAARKANQKAERMERRYGTAPSRSTVAKTEERERRAERADAPRTPRYTDKPRHVSAKADTGEVYIPRRARRAK